MKKVKFIFLSLFSLTNFISCKQVYPTQSIYREWNPSTSWILSPLQALEIYKKDGIWLNVSSEPNQLKQSTSLSWREFSVEGENSGGRLKSKDEILNLLRYKKIEITKPLLVVGDSLNGWGEEGRIVWMLRSIGITNSYFVDGGINALQFFKNKSYRENKPEEIVNKQNINENYTITSPEIVNLKNKSEYFIIDTREKREYDGQTPYGEKRGGHIPNAKWMHYKDFLDENGFILSKESIVANLEKLGFKENQTIISYCTGGVRSAFVTSILISYGFNAKNYAASMWEYSSLNPKDGFILEY